MASTKSQTTKTTVTSSNSKQTATPSEFADSKVAVGAALTFIEDLQKTLAPHKYAQILDLLNKYHSHSLNERVVYQLFKNIVKGSEDEEALIRGFERFLPEGALEGEMEEVDVVLVKDEEEGRRVMEEQEGEERKRERIVDVTEEEDAKGKKGLSGF